MAEWLVHKTHNHVIVGLNLTGASNILEQDMNPVDASQCSPSRGWQCVALGMDLNNANKAESTLALKPRGDTTRTPNQGYQWPQNRTCECVRQKKTFFKKKGTEHDMERGTRCLIG